MAVSAPGITRARQQTGRLSRRGAAAPTKALVINCTLENATEPSGTPALAQPVGDWPTENGGVEMEHLRTVDPGIHRPGSDQGVVSEAAATDHPPAVTASRVRQILVIASRPG